MDQRLDWKNFCLIRGDRLGAGRARVIANDRIDAVLMQKLEKRIAGLGVEPDAHIGSGPGIRVHETLSVGHDELPVSPGLDE